MEIEIRSVNSPKPTKQPLIIPPRNSLCKILILPGGGVFGTITSSFLANFDRGGTIKNIHAIGGTSVGGILGCLYGRGKTFGEVHDLMLDAIPRIFQKKWYNPYGIWGPMHDASIIESFLQQHLDTCFDTLTPYLFIPAISFDTGRVKVFDNVTKIDDIYMKAWEIARSTSAAPTFFAPYDCEKTSYIDGGLYENMPVQSTCIGIHNKLRVPFNQMDVFVIGTGLQHHRMPDLKVLKKWGLRSWSSPLVEFLTSANEWGSEFMAQNMGLKSFNYFNPIDLDNEWSMNDYKIVPELMKKTAKYQGLFNEEFGKWIAKLP